LRSAPSRKVTETIEKTDGERIAAGRTLQKPGDDEHPGKGGEPGEQRKAWNPASPIMKIRRRPSRSPARPPSRRKPPKVSA
jgi:hypothetical protein